MSAHTPGPWRVTGNNGVIVEGSDGIGIASVFYTRRKVKEAQANARLMAQAPRLLEALEKALHVLDDMRTINSKKYSGVFLNARAAVDAVYGGDTHDPG